SDATGQMKDGLDQLGDSSSNNFSQVLSGVSELKAAFVGLAAAVGAGAFLKGAVDQYVDMNLESKKLANQMGISVQAAAALNNAYERMGVSSETVSQALRMLERNLKTNGAAVVDMGKQVGVNIDLNAGLEDIYFKVTGALGKYEVGHQRNQAALAAFGTRVQDINSLLLVNQQDVEASAEHLAKLGLALDDVSVNKARSFKAGMHVKHAAWGEGLVVDVRLQDGDERIDVFFETAGIKRLLGSIANLEIIQ
ncbi:MAG: phage tail tape measure protein, partial [Anaerolineaceae bacterium]